MTLGLTLVLEALRGRELSSTGTIPAATSAQEVHAAVEVATRNKVLLAVLGPMLPALSPSDLEFSHNYRLRTLANNAALLREIVRVNRHLSDNKIDHIFIKGPIQSGVIYGDFLYRPASDIDVLVAARDYSHCVAVLAEIDFRPASTSIWWRAFLGEQHLVKKGDRPVTVDLHYRLQQPGSPPPKDMGRYLANPGYSTVLDVQVPRFADKDIPILSAISIVKALFNRETCGAHVCDLFALVKADTPEASSNFLVNADEQNLRGTALLALRIVSATFNVRYPMAEEIAAILPELADERLVRMAFTPLDPDLVWPRRRDVLWALCLQNRRAYAREILRSLASETALRLFERRPSPTAVAGPDQRRAGRSAPPS